VATTVEIPSIEIHQLQTRTGASGTDAKGVGEGGNLRFLSRRCPLFDDR
jgi:hypothetical protein